MSTAVKGGVFLAVVVGLVSVLFLATKLLLNPVMSIVYLVLVIGLNIWFVYWALKQTADKSGYGGQLLNSVVLGAVAGILIFVISMANLSLQAGAFDEIATASLEKMALDGAPQEQVDAMEPFVRSKVANSIQGLVGTFFTSVIAGAITAFFKRTK